MTRSFKSVGFTAAETTAQNNAVARTPVPVGIVTPLMPGTSDEGLLAMSYDVGIQMKNNLRDLIMTNWGERVMLYDYGANLQPLVTEYENGKETFDDAVDARICAAVGKWMPYVDLENFETTQLPADEQGTGSVVIYIYYSIPRALIPTTLLEVRFTLS